MKAKTEWHYNRKEQILNDLKYILVGFFLGFSVHGALTAQVLTEEAKATLVRTWNPEESYDLTFDADDQQWVWIEKEPPTIADLIRAYEDYCNEEVADTVEQTGTIAWGMIPVKDGEGKIVHYSMANPDTTWNDVDCPEYKHKIERLRWSDPGNGILLYEGTSQWFNLSTTAGPLEGTTKATKHKTKVTRDYICKCKRREIEPWSDHFWKWIKTEK